MRIAITGGAGFVGLATAEALLKRGHTPLLLDLAPPQHAGHPALNGARFLPCDVTDAAQVRAALAGAEPDLLIHTAALTPDAKMERAAAAKIIAVNLTGTSNVLDAATALGVRRVFYLSSAAVYGGDPRPGETLPEDAELRPNSLYGITKEASEKLVRLVAAREGLDATILRLGPLFGAWEVQGAARPSLSAQGQILALDRAGITPTLPSTMVADWVYSRDVGAALAALAEAPAAAETETFNLGAGYVSSPLDWAEQMGAPAVVAKDGPANVVARVSDGRPPLDISRLAARIGYRGMRPLPEACADHAAWLDQIYSEERPLA